TLLYLISFFSKYFPKIQKIEIQTMITIVLIGFLANSRTLVPTYEMEKIMTALPSKTARINCFLLTLDKPATALIIDDGEKGKHKRRNNKTKPFRSTHEITRSTCLLWITF